jgi:hypothetical protein
MEKPSFNIPLLPFNLHTIPSWIAPELWNLDAPVSSRRSKILRLYALSWAIGMAACASAFAMASWLVHRFDSKVWLGFVVLLATFLMMYL